MMKQGEYQELLERIERENPGEPLLATLRGGHNRVNVLFMASAAKRLPEPVEEAEIEEIEPEDADVNDAVLNSLHDEKRSLFAQMYRQSNVFHSCKSDEERADNSRAVLAIWDGILHLKAKIKYYLEHHELPKEAVEGDDLPDNPVLLGKKLNSLRAQISQIQRRLEGLAERPDDNRDKARLIQDAEAQLRKKKHLKGLAEQKLKSLEHG